MYKVYFTHNHCLIQDSTIIKMIGSGESFKGMYHLILENKDHDNHATYQSSSYCITEHALTTRKIEFSVRQKPTLKAKISPLIEN